MEKKILFMITVWSFLIVVPIPQGMGTHFPAIHAEGIQSMRSFELNRKSIVMAENEPKAAANRSQSMDENQDQAAVPQAAVKENSGSDADAAAEKPLKPFKPSEEIAAEQAVDFPVDI